MGRDFIRLSTSLQWNYNVNNCFFFCFFQVPTKKLKKFEKEYQTLRESQLQQEDPIDRYQVQKDTHPYSTFTNTNI